jgi:hypothetical protein
LINDSSKTMTQIRKRINLPEATGLEITPGLKCKLYRQFLMDEQLSPSAARVFFIVLDLCMDGRDWSWPSYEKISKLCSVSERTAKSAVDELEAGGWLYVARFNDGKSSNLFLPAWRRALKTERDEEQSSGQRQPFANGGAEFSPHPVQDLHPGDAKFAPKTSDSNPLGETPKETQIPAAAADRDDSDVGIDDQLKSRPQPVNDNHAWPVGGFDQFKRLFPSFETDRPDQDWRLARIQFGKVRKSGRLTFDQLMSGLQAYVDNDDGTWRCKPATWLRNERWDDEYSVGRYPNLQTNLHTRRTVAI